MNQKFNVEENNIPLLTSEIIRTILYFDLFDHPLRINEIKKFLRVKINSTTELEKLVCEAVEKGWLENKEGFYQNALNSKNLLQSRKDSEAMALEYFPKAIRYSSIIQSFPFTKSVAVSGSLSKNCMYEKGDIDYFIITSKNRLWINRMLLTLFKKIFLLNSKKYFCINYFVTEDRLKIDVRNTFIATEILTLLPYKGMRELEEFFRTNHWVNDYFPNESAVNTSWIEEIRKPRLTIVLERILSGKVGDKLDDLFMNIIKKVKTLKHKRKTGKSFDEAYKSEKNVSKHHPENRQVKIPKLLNQRIEDFQSKHHLRLTLLPVN